MLTKTQAIQKFLDGQKLKVDLYDPALEVQVNVIPGTTRLPSERGVKWTNEDGAVWYPFRIPYNAGTDGNYEDKPIDFHLPSYVEAIGLTGWDWFNKLSRWVGFDFDSIIGHQKGLSQDELDSLIARVKNVPWITIRRSKSGKGIHLYVFFKTPVPTSNHSEHAALARAILSNLSSLLGFNFYDKVDGIGGVLWIWHRSASADNGSFKLLQDGEELDTIPSNWRDHISQVTSKKRTLPKLIAQDAQAFNDIVNNTKQINLDEGHRALLTWFANKQTTWWYDQDLNMLVCHTKDLEDAHRELKLRGTFTTNSTGKDRPYDQNCFAFPIRNGAWIIRRHGRNVQESQYWIKDSKGWTRCFYNRLPDLVTAARIHNGIRTGNGSYTFKSLDSAIDCVETLGFRIDKSELGARLTTRAAKIKPGKGEGELIISFDREQSEGLTLSDWAPVRGPLWERVVIVPTEVVTIEPPDDKIRYTVRAGEGHAWYMLVREQWIREDKGNVKSALTALGYPHNEHDTILGQIIFNNWTIVTKPFEPEYPGNREWNLNAPQFVGTPREGKCDTWLTILKHLGEGLDEGVKNNEWCAKYNVATGFDYLALWVACLFRYPSQPLPYLFFYSNEQDTGKSTLHEALQYLFKGGIGYTRADHALTNSSGFNGELSNAVLCAVEEVDLQKNAKAYDRIKDWVTGRTIAIRDMQQTARTQTNTTHWIQCANDPNYCPILPGDTRITVCEVKRPKALIPKDKLMIMLQEESLAFLYWCLNLPIPDPEGRLRLPALSSALKTSIATSNENPVKAFVENCCSFKPGYATLYSVVFDKFLENLDMTERMAWTKRKFTKALPPHQHPVGGAGNGGNYYIGNLVIDGVENVRIGETQVFLNNKGRLQTGI